MRLRVRVWGEMVEISGIYTFDSFGGLLSLSVCLCDIFVSA